MHIYIYIYIHIYISIIYHLLDFSIPHYLTTTSIRQRLVAQERRARQSTGVGVAGSSETNLVNVQGAGDLQAGEDDLNSCGCGSIPI